jgi:hypothetical protein
VTCVTITAIGLELSASTDAASIAVAARDGQRWLADLMWYGDPDGVVAECSRLSAALKDNCRLFCDPQASAGVLDDLRAAGLWLHLLEATDVSASQFQLVTEVRHRRVRLGGHPALRESARAAVPRPVTARFGFQRKQADVSPLNSAAYALWGLRRNEAAADPGVYVF